MPAQRYDPKTRSWYEIPLSMVSRGSLNTEGVSFDKQIMQGYQRAEAKGQRINGRAAGIKKIWATN